MDAGADIDRVGHNVQRLQLLPQLEQTIHVGDAAQMVAVLAGVVGPQTFGLELAHHGLSRFLVGDQVDFSPEQVSQHQVAVHRFSVAVVPAYHHAPEAQPSRHRRGQPRLVRLRPGTVQQHVVAFIDRWGERVLEFPYLVATESHPGLVFPLDQNARSPQGGAEARAILQRRREVPQGQPRASLQRAAQVRCRVGRGTAGHST